MTDTNILSQIPEDQRPDLIKEVQTLLKTAEEKKANEVSNDMKNYLANRKKQDFNNHINYPIKK